MNLKSVLSGLGGVAEELLPLVGGGAPAAVLGLAHSITAAIASAKAIHTGQPVPSADKAGAALFAAVSRHAESTFARAEGGS